MFLNHSAIVNFRGIKKAHIAGWQTIHFVAAPSEHWRIEEEQPPVSGE